MSNGHRIEYTGEQLVKCRKIMYSEAVTAVVLGTAVLAIEIAVCVLEGQRQGLLSSEQLLATIAVFISVLAGLASIGPSKLDANPYTLRRSFIIAAIVSLLATLFLGVALGLFAVYAWDYWTAANAQTGTHPQSTLNSYVHTGLPNVVYTNQPTFLLDKDPGYTAKVIAILKFTALIGEAFIIGATLLCTILSIVNAQRRRGNYAPAPVQETNRVYYDKCSK